jgi:hypothetical protein
MRTLGLALGLMVLAPAVALAQQPGTSPSDTLTRAQLETLCSRNPASPACAELRRELPPTTTGTLPGPGNPNRPSDGVAGSSDGVSGSAAGGITRQGNPANAGGSPRSGQ